jgi:hypothetical protein
MTAKCSRASERSHLQQFCSRMTEPHRPPSFSCPIDHWIGSSWGEENAVDQNEHCDWRRHDDPKERPIRRRDERRRQKGLSQLGEVVEEEGIELLQGQHADQCQRPPALASLNAGDRANHARDVGELCADPGGDPHQACHEEQGSKYASPPPRMGKAAA